jgi:UTP--glucose-1-phosphate uridylyltransferase
MIAAYPRIGGNFAAVAPFRHDHAARHGVLAAAHDGDRLLAVTRLATQPTPGDPTMKWTAVGRFILDPAFIERLRPSSAVAGEIELVDGLAAAAADGALSGYAFTGRHFDCSSTLGLFEANIAFTLARPDLGAAARNLLTFHVHRGDMPAVAHSIATPDLAASA